MIKNFLELIRFRELLKNLVSKDLKVRYKRSILGYFWTMLNPLLMMVVYTIVFAKLFRFDMENYSVYLISGLLPWTFFLQSVMSSNMSIINSAGLIKKVYVPKSIFPISNVSSNLIHFLLAIIPLFILMPILGLRIKVSVLFLPIPIIILYIFSSGMSLVFSALNVFFRDISHIIDVLFQAWFYFTPILYPVTMIPDNYLKFFKLNPMYYFIKCFQLPIYDGVLPDINALLISFSMSLFIFLFGWWFFHKCENNFIHYI